jgi:hypothetical protein
VQGCAFPHIVRLKECANLRALGLQLRKDLAGAIRGPIIDANQFDIERNSEHSLDYLRKGSALVVDRHDDGKLHSYFLV